MGERRVGQMLEYMAVNDAVGVVSPLASVRKGAALAHVAQQYGFLYAEAQQMGQHQSQLAVVLVRDPSPEAAQYAAETASRYPDAGCGGAVPGMRQDTLKPLPEAEAAVELLQARITFDITGRQAEKRLFKALAALVAGVLVAPFLKDWAPTAVPLFLAVAVPLCLVFAGGLVYTRVRHNRAAASLRSAGLQGVQDETGRIRYLPSAEHLPW